MLTIFFLILLFCVFFFWIFYTGTPFVSVIFVTSLSAILGFFLLSLDLGFAGMVLIIVNAGAIAVVFLFVCILAKRETVVTRAVPLLFFPCMAVFFFAMTNLSTRILGFLVSSVFDEHLATVNNNPLISSSSTFVKDSLRIADHSLSSHLFLTIFSPQWWPVLILVGFFLFLIMIVAINVTKTWTNAPVSSFLATSFVNDKSSSVYVNNSSNSLRVPVGYYNKNKFAKWQKFKKNLTK